MKSVGRMNELAPEHEGFMERELSEPVAGAFAYMGHHDESTDSVWCSGWTNGLPSPTGRWRSACECGWKGVISDGDTIYAIDPDHDPGKDMLDETVEDLLMAAWSSHVDPFRSLAQLRAAATSAAIALQALDDAVGTARSAGNSWALVAVEVGLTRQAAHARWAQKMSDVE